MRNALCARILNMQDTVSYTIHSFLLTWQGEQEYRNKDSDIELEWYEDSVQFNITK